MWGTMRRENDSHVHCVCAGMDIRYSVGTVPMAAESVPSSRIPVLNKDTYFNIYLSICI